MKKGTEFSLSVVVKKKASNTQESQRTSVAALFTAALIG